MKYQLIAMDLDGTLNDDAKRITEPTRSALMRAQSEGIQIALASARPLPGLYRERDALDLQRRGGLLMAYNGGRIVDAATGAVLHESGMALDEARQVLRALEKMPCTPILDDGVQFYVTDRNGYKVDYECRNNNMRCDEVANLADFIDFAPVKILMSVDPPALPGVQRQIAALLPEGLTVTQSAPFYLEVLPKAINKGQGLRDTCRLAGVPLEAAIAFGDAENDIAMLRAAGMGVAMGNADERVKAAADRVTLDNNHDGIAAALEALLWPALQEG